MNYGEQCDDGNAASGDGCTATCQVEAGSSCSGSPSVCGGIASGVCGNGAIEAGEACDDGDVASGDGCSGTCQVELAYRCSQSPSVCALVALCGNGAAEYGEGCDDGNSTTEACAYGATACLVCGATCSVVAGAARVCGDGTTDAPNEECDDGNTLAGDDCSATCTYERCSNGIDDDMDGLVETADPGCADAADLSENAPTLPCDDGIDNDGDGKTDYRTDGGKDPGCFDDVSSNTENPQCQDGIDNDGATGIDFDGGASRHGGVAIDVVDPQCADKPYRNREAPNPPNPPTCGFGAEVTFAMALLMRGFRRARQLG